MIALKEGRGSFADALTGALDAKVGCVTTVTFDPLACISRRYTRSRTVDSFLWNPGLVQAGEIGGLV
jgi:hypothetical protein